MMALRDQLNQDLKDAMRSGDEVRKTTLRQLLAGLRQAQLDKRTAAVRAMGAGSELTSAQLSTLDQVDIDDSDAVAVLQREAKAHRESIADAAKAGRDDLVAANEAELRVIEVYLPQQLSRDEIKTLARAAIAEAGVSDIKQLGAVMKVLTPRTKGRADGRLVNEVVRELLAG
jgi:uncharacterized protein YqeY